MNQPQDLDFFDLRTLIRVVWRARYIVAACALGLAIAAYSVSHLMTPCLSRDYRGGRCVGHERQCGTDCPRWGNSARSRRLLASVDWGVRSVHPTKRWPC